MSGFTKKLRNIQAFDTEAMISTVDLDDFDDSSKLMEHFTKKNRGVKKLFRKSGGPKIEEKPYEIHLTNKPKEKPQSMKLLEKAKESLRKPSEHIQILSPVNIVSLTSDQVNNPLPPVSKCAIPSSNLRRSLLKSALNQNKNILVTSTPLGNEAGIATFFSDIASSVKTNLLRKYEETVTSPTFDPASPIEHEEEAILELPESPRPIVIEKFAPINALEKQLEGQFVSDRPLVSSHGSVRSSSVPNKGLRQEHSLSMMLDAVSLVKVPIQKTPSLRKTSGDRTNINIMAMEETPVCNSQGKQTSSSTAADKELVIKLKRCDESVLETDDETDDESESENSCEESVTLSSDSEQNNELFSIPPTQEPSQNQSNALAKARPGTASESDPNERSQPLTQKSSTRQEPGKEALVAHNVSSETLDERSPKDDRKKPISSNQSGTSTKTSRDTEARTAGASGRQNQAGKNIIQTAQVAPETAAQKRMRPPGSPSVSFNGKSIRLTADEKQKRKRIKVVMDSSESDAETEACSAPVAQSEVEHPEEPSQGNSNNIPTQAKSSNNSRKVTIIETDTVSGPTKASSATLSTPTKQTGHSKCSQPSSQSTRTAEDFFVKPLGPKIRSNKDASQESVRSDWNESPQRTIPPEVMKSLLSLRNLSVIEKENVQSSSDSLKINVTAKRRSRRENPSAQVYLETTKQNKRKSESSVGRKRTLYSSDTSLSSNVGTVSGGSSSEKNPPVVAENHSNESVEAVSKKKRYEEEDDDEASDEGFDSEANGTVNDIRYDPYKQGCTRLGLRVRRFAKPWWIQTNAAKSNYGITYGLKSYKQLKAEMKMKETLKKNNTKELKLFPTSIENFFGPSEKLKLCEAKKESLEVKKKEKELKQKTKNTGQAQSSADDGQATAPSIASIASTGKVIQSICDGTSNALPATASVSRAAYDFSSIGNMAFSDCGNGLYYGAYIENKSDGIIKLIPGGFKSKSKSKNSVLKFFVLLGIVDIAVEDETVTLDPMGYISVNPGHSYEIRNTSDQDVLIYFTRFDRVIEEL